MSDEAGTTAMEYALIGTIISIVVVTSVGAMGGKLLGFFNTVAGSLR